MPNLSLLLKLVRLMVSPALRARFDITLGVVAEILGTILTVAGPYVLKVLVDMLSSRNASPELLTLYVALFVLAWTGTSITAAYRLVYTNKIVDKLSRHLFGAALRSQLPVIARERSGDTGRVLGLLERLPYSLQVVIEGLLWRAGPLLIQTAVSLAVISTLVPMRYVLMMAAILAGYFLAAHFGSGRYQERSRQTNRAAGSVSQALGDVLRNARRVVFNGNLESELRHIADHSTGKLEAARAMSWSLVQMQGLQYGVVGLGLMLLLVLGGLDVAAGRLTIGGWVLLQAYAFRLALPLSGFGFVLQQSGVALANIRDVLDLTGSSDSLEPQQLSEPRPAAIDLDGVDFRYGPGLAGLSDVSARIASGSFVVIVGPNGSGKSTLAQLIAGLLEPASGAIRINDVDLAAIPRGERHRQILYVPQFIGLFNRSLRANALYPPTRLSEADIMALLGEWQFYEDGRTPDFDLMVGEQGERLSGGQIQKLELARLVGVSVPALILDESTSSLDVRSEERAIRQILDTFKGSTTLILITHRLRLAQTADQVLYLRGGKLLAAGRHEDLIERSPAYRDHWALEPIEDAGRHLREQEGLMAQGRHDIA